MVIKRVVTGSTNAVVQKDVVIKGTIPFTFAVTTYILPKKRETSNLKTPLLS